MRPQPPAVLGPLERLVRNMRWTWHPATRELLEEIDPALWREVGGDPLKLLAAVSVQRLEQLAADDGFLERMHELDQDLTNYLESPHWYSRERDAAAADGRGRALPDAVAYFSMEFGISEVLPNFSGGLGVLAGDHLKSASDLGVPLIAVGLFYRFGYFSQTLSADGWQQEVYSAHDPHSLCMELATDRDGAPIEVTVAMPGDRELRARVWLVRVGRVSLLLLDADIEANDDALRQTTDRLYGGDQDHRIRQEILLGIGGARAVRAYCAARDLPQPEVFHMNEGHAGFSGLERMRSLVDERGLTSDQALAVVRAGTVFTTHTPVPAGIDRFPMDLVRHYLNPDDDGLSRLLPGLAADEVLAMGSEDDPGRFNMAHLGLRLAQRANGVAQLHGDVSRHMFAGLYPGFDADEVPIGSVTNGVHLATWQDSGMRAISERLAGSADLNATDSWPHLDAVDAKWLWSERCRLRTRLVDYAREAVRESWLQRGLTTAELGWTETILDPNILTIGFARRVSTYKRLTLMLRDRDRLKSILLDPEHPVQIVIAGKAHPADDGGKRLMQEMVNFADDPEVRHRVVFLPNYSMTMAAILCSGADVWLNNPIRPQEASGTSGMKAALNGALNLSISDGWWDELYDGHDGWTIPSVEVSDDGRRDDLESAALYELLESRVAPLFYERDHGDLPTGWVDMVLHTLSYLGPRVQATRMVRDYVREYYGPASVHASALTHVDATAHDFAAWLQKVRLAWPHTRIMGVDVSGIDTEPAFGHTMTVRAYVDLAGLSDSDVTVQTVIGRLGPDHQLHEPRVADMEFVGNGDGHRFQAHIPLERAGSLGYTVRVMPKHSLLASPAELGLVTTP